MSLDTGVPVLVFDGRCGFCTWSVEWLRARLRTTVHLVPFQAIDPARYGLTRDRVAAAVWWIEPGHTRYSGAAAIARALRACGGRWSWLGRLLGLPLLRSLAAVGYAIVTRIRGHLPGAPPAWPEGALARGITVAAPSRR